MSLVFTQASLSGITLSSISSSSQFITNTCLVSDTSYVIPSNLHRIADFSERGPYLLSLEDTRVWKAYGLVSK